MPTVTQNFTTVKGVNNLTALLGTPTSVGIANLGGSPGSAGKLGWCSLRLTSFTGQEQFGFSCWYGGTAKFTSGLNNGLRPVFIARKAGLSLQFAYTY
jgi:hypothetical protein